MYGLILERDMFGLFRRLIGDVVGRVDVLNLMNLFDFRFYKKLVLLLVHYFIDYNCLLSKVPPRNSPLISFIHEAFYS
jgi:hypothetical protein